MKAILRGLGLAASVCCTAGAASAAGTYGITAANLTMPMSGNGSTTFTVSGIPMTGTLSVVCAYSGPKTTARIPNCDSGPLIAYQVTAGQTLKGSITFYPYGVFVPLGQERASAGVATAFMALSAAFLIRLRRRNWRWLSLMVFSFAAVAGVSACGGGSGMTAGSYQYTITANNEGTLPLGQGVSTTIMVNVP